MKLNNAALIRIWVIGLAITALFAGFLIASVNPLITSLIFLPLILAVLVTGILSNFWAGLVTSALATLAIVIINHSAGIYASQNPVVNMASELGVVLISGLVAGGVARSIDHLQNHIGDLQKLAEMRVIHDETFFALRLEWGKARLKEEVLRAGSFNRPLVLALLEFKPLAADSTDNQGENTAAMQAFIRISQSIIAIGSVVALAGRNKVMLILPEHNNEKVKDLLFQIQTKVGQEVYFPSPKKGLGKPLRTWGVIYSGLANFTTESSDELFIKASDELEKQTNV